MEPQAFKTLVNQYYTIKEPVESAGRPVSTNIKLIPKLDRVCNHCDRTVRDQHIFYIRRALESDNPYWIKKCDVCNLKTRITRPFDTDRF